jgi:hypothetical protein
MFRVVQPHPHLDRVPLPDPVEDVLHPETGRGGRAGQLPLAGQVWRLWGARCCRDRAALSPLTTFPLTSPRPRVHGGPGPRGASRPRPPPPSAPPRPRPAHRCSPTSSLPPPPAAQTGPTLGSGCTGPPAAAPPSGDSRPAAWRQHAHSRPAGTFGQAGGGGGRGGGGGGAGGGGGGGGGGRRGVSVGCLRGGAGMLNKCMSLEKISQL